MPFSCLYPILDTAFVDEASLPGAIRALARAGLKLVQLRSKESSDETYHRIAESAAATARDSGVRLIVNDRPDVARLVGAEGVHVGQDDVSPSTARRVLGEKAVVGLSTHSMEQAKGAESDPAVDYVAIGPIFSTHSKASPDRALGVEGARAVRELVSKPLVAIGGITRARAPALFEAGIDGVAVISALHREVSEGVTLEHVARRWLSLKRR